MINFNDALNLLKSKLPIGKSSAAGDATDDSSANPFEYDPQIDGPQAENGEETFSGIYGGNSGNPGVHRRGFGAKLEPKQKLRLIYIGGIALVGVVCLVAMMYAILFSKDARYAREMERGQLYLENNNYQQAVESYSIVLKIDEQCTEAYINRAEAYSGMSDYANAEKDYEKALELDPTNYDVYLALANVIVAQGRSDDAIKVLENGYSQTRYAPIYEMLYTLKSEVCDTTISGLVSNYDNGVVGGAAGGVKITLRDRNLDREMSINYTDENGAYSINTVAGDYTLTASADGCLSFSYNITVSEGQHLSMERVLLINESNATGNGSLQLQLKDASSGELKSGISLNLREGWDTFDGDYVFTSSIITNEQGVGLISNIPAGYYTLEYSCDGYITGNTNIAITAGDTVYLSDCVCDVMPEDSARIVLTWGRGVTDLDLNVANSDGSIHVYYGNKAYDDGTTVRLMLNCKNSTGYGPETISILGGIVGDSYTVYVHDYDNRAKESNCQAMSNCDAVIRIYVEDKLVSTVYIPAGNDGTYWYACTINSDWSVTQIDEFSFTGDND